MTLGAPPVSIGLQTSHLFRMFSDLKLTSLDITNYESPKIMDDLQSLVPPDLVNQFDFVWNDSCLDNIGSACPAMVHSASLLRRDGERLFIMESANAHFGAYSMFSSAWFFDYFALNKFQSLTLATLTVAKSLGFELVRVAEVSEHVRRMLNSRAVLGQPKGAASGVSDLQAMLSGTNFVPFPLQIAALAAYGLHEDNQPSISLSETNRMTLELVMDSIAWSTPDFYKIASKHSYDFVYSQLISLYREQES